MLTANLTLNFCLGVFFNTTISLPTDCKREPMCEVIREKMNAGSQLILEGEVTEDGMTLKAGWMGDGISFGENLLLMNAVVQLSVTKEGTEFYIQGSMKFVKQKIIFKGEIYFIPKTFFIKDYYIYFLYP